MMQDQKIEPESTIRARGYKTFFHAQLNWVQNLTFHKLYKMLKIKGLVFSVLELTEVVFIMLINVKMPTF